MMAVNRLKTKKRTTAKRTDTIRVCGLPSFNRNAIHQLTSNSWFGNIGNILHIEVKSNDNVHIAEITFSSKKEAQSALRWVHQYNCGSKPKSQRKLQANYTQITNKPSQLSGNITNEWQSRALKTLKQKNQLLHQIIERLRANLHRNKERKDVLTAKNKTLEEESQTIKSLQLKELYDDNQYLLRQQQALEVQIQSIRADNDRLKQIHAILETATVQKQTLQTNYALMQQQMNVILCEQQRMMSDREHSQEQYGAAAEWYTNIQSVMSSEKRAMIEPQPIAPMVWPSPPSLTEEPVAQTMPFMADDCDWVTVCHWIVGIQDGILMKYVNELTTELRVRKTDFNDLYEMDANDLQAIGITDRKDVILLFSEIQKLRLSNEIETAIEGDTDVKMEIEGDLSM
eukprot:603787_1